MVNDGLTQFPPTFDAHVRRERWRPPIPREDAANQLTQLLQARGVTIAGPPQPGTAPQGATEVTKIDSPPIEQIVAEMLRESDNEAAELLTQEIGLHDSGAGTTANGVAGTRQTLQQRNLPLDGTTQVDGSGLARDNQTTCAFVQALLDADGPGSTRRHGSAGGRTNGHARLPVPRHARRGAAAGEDGHAEPGHRARRATCRRRRDRT